MSNFSPDSLRHLFDKLSEDIGIPSEMKGALRFVIKTMLPFGRLNTLRNAALACSNCFLDHVPGTYDVFALAQYLTELTQNRNESTRINEGYPKSAYLFPSQNTLYFLPDLIMIETIDNPESLIRYSEYLRAATIRPIPPANIINSLGNKNTAHIQLMANLIRDIFLSCARDEIYSRDRYKSDLTGLFYFIKYHAYHYSSLPDEAEYGDVLDHAANILDCLQTASKDDDGNDTKRNNSISYLRSTIQLIAGLPNIESKNSYEGRQLGQPIKSGPVARKRKESRDKESDSGDTKRKTRTKGPVKHKHEPFPAVFPYFQEVVGSIAKNTERLSVTEDSSNDPISGDETKSDRLPRKRSRSTSASTARRNTPSPADLCYVSVSTCLDYLQYLIKRKYTLMYAYAYLCLATGISWNRLGALAIASDDQVPSNDKQIYLSITTCTLTYRIKKGATEFSKNFEVVMRLNIPQAITQIIGQSGSSTPFYGMPKRVGRSARRFGRKYSAASPTPARLNSTFFRVFANYGLSRPLRSLIRGDFGWSHRAFAKYVSFDIESTNKRYQDCAANFCEEMQILCMYDSIDTILPLDFCSTIPSGRVGSQLARPLEDFTPLIHEFSEIHNRSSRGRGSRDVLRVIEATQIAYTYYYLMLQLIIGMRPIGDRTTITIVDEDVWFISQKDSANYIERTLIQVPRIILEQLDSCHRHISALVDRLNSHGYKFHSEFNDELAYPVLIQLDPNHKIVTARKMHGDDFNVLLKQFSLGIHTPWILTTKNNVYRHSIYTHLADKYHETIASNLLQHHRFGVELFSEWSASDTTYYFDLSQYLDNIARKIGFNVLKLWGKQ